MANPNQFTTGMVVFVEPIGVDQSGGRIVGPLEDHPQKTLVLIHGHRSAPELVPRLTSLSACGISEAIVIRSAYHGPVSISRAFFVAIPVKDAPTWATLSTHGP
jgi:hypothetical protein